MGACCLVKEISNLVIQQYCYWSSYTVHMLAPDPLQCRIFLSHALTPHARPSKAFLKSIKLMMLKIFLCQDARVEDLLVLLSEVSMLFSQFLGSWLLMGFYISFNATFLG